MPSGCRMTVTEPRVDPALDKGSCSTARIKMFSYISRKNPIPASFLFMVDCLCMTILLESRLLVLELLLGRDSSRLLDRVLLLCFWRVHMSLLSWR